MPRTLTTVSAQITSLAFRQPRIAVAAGLGGILLLKLLVLLLSSHQLL